MQHFSTDALVLRAVDRGDNDKLLTVLAPDFGRFYAILKGAHSVHRETAATEPYTWSNIEFYEKNGVKWVKNAVAIETFPGIRYDMDKLFLVAYFAEIATDLSDEREPAGEILPLTLNALHKLSFEKDPNERVKAVVEMRAAAIAGFAPDLNGCSRCGAVGDGYLDVMNGRLICEDCFRRASAIAPVPEFNDLGERNILVPVTSSAAAALRYVTEADAKRVFAFSLSDDASRADFCRAAETYLLHHLEHGFQTLDNYKKLRALRPNG